jgi:hypothetical protein
VEPELSLTWVKRGDDFYSSPSGRFDVFRSAHAGDWVALDTEEGKRFRGSLIACERWVKARTGKRRKAGSAS